MVVADQSNWQADVVFVIEGTANISPYVESLKSNYIIPTLEYFNGSPIDDIDCGCDTNCTMYALVVFMAADCALETASTCFAPTASTNKFLTWMDKVKFIGGAGESHSHVAEGLSTALQVFDDFQTFRESGIPTQKHCILICNSPPYPLPALESSAYSGLMTEELCSLMANRQIHFSVLSPRKIPTLFKMYEKAGGDLQHALTKNYAKDRRHLVLLKGFQLLERPMSPPSLDSKAASNVSVCSPSPATGQKRPATNSPPNPREASGFKQPATQGNYTGLEWSTSEGQTGPMPPQNPIQAGIQAPNPGQMPMGYGQNMPGQPNQSLPQRPGMPNPASHLNSMNQPNPPNVTITNKGPPPHTDGIRPQRGHSPIPTGPPRMQWNQPGNPSSPASTSPTTSVLATQLNMGPSNMPMRHNNPQMPGNPNVSMAQPNMNNPNVMNTARGQLQNLNLRMPNPSGANPLAAQLNHPQPPFGQPQPTSAQQQAAAMAMQSKLGSNNPAMQQGGTAQQGQPGPPAATKDRRTIWQGILDFQEKSNHPQVQGQRVVHSLTCTFSSMVTSSGDSDV
ncbi:hypothetical protein JTE90_016108 [Oedothorax gibbosus]|uniref:Mediator of RNA polymerase II transcription subunit 25 n=1 Tax=Oedothorax gibbosus TaxID=931172 RepID=A0AAV6U4F0_9ARAC|nr:hypothetical protein JTE90_016108 [Oedothorax gibbosus]